MGEDQFPLPRFHLLEEYHGEDDAYFGSDPPDHRGDPRRSGIDGWNRFQFKLLCDLLRGVFYVSGRGFRALHEKSVEPEDPDPARVVTTPVEITILRIL